MCDPGISIKKSDETLAQELRRHGQGLRAARAELTRRGYTISAYDDAGLEYRILPGTNVKYVIKRTKTETI